MNPLVYFAAVILKVLQVNLLAALNFASVFLIKNVWKIKKRKKRKNVTKKRQKTFFTSNPSASSPAFGARADTAGYSSCIRLFQLVTLVSTWYLHTANTQNSHHRLRSRQMTHDWCWHLVTEPQREKNWQINKTRMLVIAASALTRVSESLGVNSNFRLSPNWRRQGWDGFAFGRRYDNGLICCAYQRRDTKRL